MLTPQEIGTLERAAKRISEDVSDRFDSDAIALRAIIARTKQPRVSLPAKQPRITR